jgi:pSer/pThr/pTyr-binding forkhead associated (FHA) protein
MSKLVLHLADGTTLDIPLDKERITLGRRSDNDICLPNLAVSGEHAAVVTILDDSFLEDLGSTNGTLVNGNAIVKHFLRDRDEVDVGQHKLVYYENDDEVVTSHYVARGMRPAAGDLGDQVQVAKSGPRSKRISAGSRSQKIAGSTRDGAVAVKPRGSKSATTPMRSTLVDAPIAAPVPAAPRKAVKILTGPQAGREIPLIKEQTSIGRAGVQVALISQTGETFRLTAIEGNAPPLVNGQPAIGAGVGLSPGDVIDIAGSRLEFVYRA